MHFAKQLCSELLKDVPGFVTHLLKHVSDIFYPKKEGGGWLCEKRSQRHKKSPVARPSTEHERRGEYEVGLWRRGRTTRAQAQCRRGTVLIPPHLQEFRELCHLHLLLDGCHLLLLLGTAHAASGRWRRAAV